MSGSCTRLVTVFVAVVSLYGQVPNTARELSVQHREWLDLVAYIILPEEEKVFRQLADDRDREIFIISFWNQRDPTPGTPQNEFKDEHIRRFNYANAHLARGTSRPGWTTDQGRIYIILGPPHSKEDFFGTSGLLDCEVWYYYGDPAKSLPTHFGLIFFRKGQAGPFRLYDPVSDGPAALLEDPSPRDLTEVREVYARIHAEAPDLAPLTLSLIPGTVPYTFQPSMQASMILANIALAPKKDIRTSYATHFLNYKGVVSMEYLTNFVECEAKVVIFHDPTLGQPFVHFMVKPASISVDYFQANDQYFTNFELDVSLRRGDTLVHQYSKEFPLYFPEEEVKGVTGSGVCLQDAFPAAEGDFRLTILYKNSVGKEFAVLERDISIPAAGPPRITGPLLGYRFEQDARDVITAFKVRSQRIFPDPADLFAARDTIVVLTGVTGIGRDLWEQGAVEIGIRGLREKEAYTRSVRHSLNERVFEDVLIFETTFLASDVPPDYYEMAVKLIGPDGQAIDLRVVPFTVSPKSALARPRVISRTLAQNSGYLLLVALASQYEVLGDVDRAGSLYRKAFEAGAGDPESAVPYARFLLKTGEYDRALAAVEPLNGRQDMAFEYHLLRGKAYLGKAMYAEASEALLAGNRIYDSDVGLLNALGYTLDKLGKTEMALQALRASLRLDPDQEQVKNLVAEITARKRPPEAL